MRIVIVVRTTRGLLRRIWGLLGLFDFVRLGDGVKEEGGDEKVRRQGRRRRMDER